MIELPNRAAMADYQRYIHQLEILHGWQDVDLIHNCFLLGEEVGELFKAIRRTEKLYLQATESSPEKAAVKTEVAEEIVDVFNYLLALANRLEIDLEAAFRAKNAHNQNRTWLP
ncbi:MAG: MazG nucleotide pyrophosphohydrolase domain-containing protein [Candidatus Sericytochromatia bacterium]